MTSARRCSILRRYSKLEQLQGKMGVLSLGKTGGPEHPQRCFLQSRGGRRLQRSGRRRAKSKQEGRGQRLQREHGCYATASTGRQRWLSEMLRCCRRTYSQIRQPRGVLSDLRGHVTVPSSPPSSIPRPRLKQSAVSCPSFLTVWAVFPC